MDGIAEELADFPGSGLMVADQGELLSFISALASLASHFLRQMPEVERKRWLSEVIITAQRQEQIDKAVQAEIDEVMATAEAHTKQFMALSLDEQIRMMEEARQQILDRSHERLTDLAEAGQARWDDKRELFVIDGGEG